MKRFRITESERNDILRQHRSFLINEQTGVYVPPVTDVKDPNQATQQQTQTTQQQTQTTQPTNSGVSVPPPPPPAGGQQATTQQQPPQQPAQQTNYTIKQLQELLNSRGYNVGTADSQFGKKTLAGLEAALNVVKTFQGTVDAQRKAQGELSTTQTQQQSVPKPVLPAPPAQISNEPEITLKTDTTQQQPTQQTQTNLLDPQTLSRLRYANK